MKDQEEKITSNKPEEENINKIREILFGSNISEFEKRFQEMEASFKSVHEKLTEEMQNKIAHLQDHFQNEVNSLVNQLKTERELHSKVLAELNKKNEVLVNDLQEYKNENLEVHRDIRKTQLEQFSSLKQSLTDTEKAIKTELAKGDENLKNNKVDRKALALFLSELALKLNDNETTG